MATVGAQGYSTSAEPFIVGSVQADSVTSKAAITAPNVAQFVTVVLTSAQLKALQTTAIALVAAPGASSMLQPRKLTLQYKFGATAYTIANVDNTFRIEYTGKATALASSLVTGLVDQTVNTVGFVGSTSPETGIAQTNAANLGLEIKLAGTTPALTLGDGTVVVTLEYITISLQ